MSKPPPSQGKGSGRRRENTSAVRDRWDEIDWSKRELAPKRSVVRGKTRAELDEGYHQWLKDLDTEGAPPSSPDQTERSSLDTPPQT